MGPQTNTLLGNMGYNAGVRFNLSLNIDAVLQFSENSFYEANATNNFTSDISSISAKIGYSMFENAIISPYYSLGIEQISYKTIKDDIPSERASTVAIPVAAGLRLDISERIDLDATVSYTTSNSDIDKYLEDNNGSNDNFLGVNFILHYDLFTPKSNTDEYYDDSYYADVDFKALESEDEDGDLIPDNDDYCPNTPIGTKVDNNGCPLDNDKDGIADYLDKEKNTPRGVIVDENGVKLSPEKYKSMYSDEGPASRAYANFYNENEIRKEDYKTIDEYLIAKANAFNIAYNNNDDDDLSGKYYKVRIGQFNNSIPARLINKFLSIEDLQSSIDDNGLVTYYVGNYVSVDNAINREMSLENKGFSDLSIIEDEGGVISDYKPKEIISKNKPPQSKEDINQNISDIKNNLEKLNSQKQKAIQKADVQAVKDLNKKIKEENEKIITQTNALKNIENLEVNIEEDVNESATIYRIQIGAHKNKLSDEIFKGIKNVVSFKGKDGWIRYMTGSFNEYKKANDYLNEMRARGFEDAFIVTYKNGQRIGLYRAIKKETAKNKAKSAINSDDYESYSPENENKIEEKPKDQDGDSVLDKNDKCPNTPDGVAVDKNGCPLDSDNDRVPDYLDKEENTPKGAIIDKNGVQLNISYKVQIFVGKSTSDLSASENERMSSLGDINSNQEGDDAYVYWIGPFENQKDAGKILTRAKRMGFSDAFIYTELEGKRIKKKKLESIIY